jgi:Flp pilus assembly pilin Flp
MRSLLVRLWQDDRGLLEAIEFLLTASILAFGLVVGMTTLRNAIATQFVTLANAILAINYSYSVGGLSGCCSSVDGSQFIDIPTSAPGPVCTPPSIPVVNTATLPCS